MFVERLRDVGRFPAHSPCKRDWTLILQKASLVLSSAMHFPPPVADGTRNGEAFSSAPGASDEPTFDFTRSRWRLYTVHGGNEECQHGCTNHCCAEAKDSSQELVDAAEHNLHKLITKKLFKVSGYPHITPRCGLLWKFQNAHGVSYLSWLLSHGCFFNVWITKLSELAAYFQRQWRRLNSTRRNCATIFDLSLEKWGRLQGSKRSGSACKRSQKACP